MASAPLQLRFVMSAPSVAELPPTRAEVAIVGRSNVGKSSLLNALARRKDLAKTSKTPGRTQLLNLFSLGDDPLVGGSVMDLPGYGFAKVPARVRATWGPMIEGYLLGREGLRLTLLLVDGEVGPTALDLQTLEWLEHEGIEHRVIATKHDKVKSSRRDARKKELASKCGLEPKQVLWVSASTDVNIDELRTRVRDWLA